MAIEEIVANLRRDWSTARTACHHGERCPFVLRCTFTQPASRSPEAPRLQGMPDTLIDMWRRFETARLFEDEAFGQWGVELLSPVGVLDQTRSFNNERPVDAQPGDVVFGRFLGDTELLLMSGDGRIHVTRPLDERSHWPTIANNLEEFLERLVDAEGAKYWESPFHQ
jgi:hypothetical protein